MSKENKKNLNLNYALLDLAASLKEIERTLSIIVIQLYTVRSKLIDDKRITHEEMTQTTDIEVIPTIEELWNEESYEEEPTSYQPEFYKVASPKCKTCPDHLPEKEDENTQSQEILDLNK